MIALIVVLVIVLGAVAAGVVVARRAERSNRAAVERVAREAQIRQTRQMPEGPRRDVALLRQRLDAQLRATRGVLGAPGDEVFTADGPAVLAELTASATELDTSLAAVAGLAEDRQRAELPALTAQVEQLIATADTACRTALRTRARTRAGRLDALAGDVDFEAASLATYERERTDLQL